MAKYETVFIKIIYPPAADLNSGIHPIWDGKPYQRRTGLVTGYGKKLVNPDFYGTVTLFEGGDNWLEEEQLELPFCE